MPQHGRWRDWPIALDYLALSPGSSDGAGINARFNDPRGIAVESAGNTYVGDMSNRTIRVGTPP
jgi:hypothetical protein